MIFTLVKPIISVPFGKKHKLLPPFPPDVTKSFVSAISIVTIPVVEVLLAEIYNNPDVSQLYGLLEDALLIDIPVLTDAFLTSLLFVKLEFIL